MKLAVHNIELKKLSDFELDASIFGIKPRADILSRVVHWQLAKRQAGTHAVKERSFVSGSTKKIVRQKGSGGARHGGKRAPQFRGGGVVFGPVSRSHAYSLPKQIRKMALKMAFAEKIASNNMLIVEDFSQFNPKLKEMKKFTIAVGADSLLLIDAIKCDSVLKASGNLYGVDHLPVMGANVYDILRKEKVVITVPALRALEERLK